MVITPGLYCSMMKSRRKYAQAVYSRAEADGRARLDGETNTNAAVIEARKRASCRSWIALVLDMRVALSVRGSRNKKEESKAR